MLKNFKLGLLLSLAAFCAMWLYVQKVLIPAQETDAALHQRPRGNLSDLYPRWLGARELLLHHRDPYGPEVTREIQIGLYGRALDANRPGDPKDEQRFAYPVYIVFLLAPTITAPFPAVQTACRWFLLLLTIASVFLWLHVLQWHPNTSTLMSLLLLVMGSYATVQGVKLQQLSLLVSGLVAASMALLTSGYLLPAGILLALASIKPQLVVLLAAWLMLWSLSHWKERQRFFWGLFVGEALLVAAGEYVLPGWVGRFWQGVIAYRQYAGAGSILDTMTNKPVGGIIALGLVCITAVLCWKMRRQAANSALFNLVLAFILALTVVILPMVAPYNQLLLLPALFVLARARRNLWNSSMAHRVACGLVAIAIFWPWLSAFVLIFASALFTPAFVQRGWAMPLWTSLAIPLTVLALLALCINTELKIRHS